MKLNAMSRSSISGFFLFFILLHAASPVNQLTTTTSSPHISNQRIKAEYQPLIPDKFSGIKNVTTFVAPDSAYSIITSYLRSAKKSIHLEVYSMSDYFLIKEYGIIGAAVATFMSYLAVVVMCNYYLDMDLGLNFLTKLMRIGLASLSIMLWLYFHARNSYLNIGLNILIGFAFYMFFIFLLRVVRFKDIRMRFT